MIQNDYTISKNLHLATFEVDKSGFIKYFNNAARNLFEFQPDQSFLDTLSQWNCFTTSESNKTAEDNPIFKSLFEGVEYDDCLVSIDTGADTKWVSLSSIIKNDRPDKCFAVQFNLIDITDAVSTENNFRPENQGLDKIQEVFQKNVLVSLINENGIIQDVNDEYCRFSDYSREEIIGQKHDFIYADSMTAPAWDGVFDSLKEEKVWSGEVKYRAKDGTYFWLDSRISQIEDDFGKSDKFLCIGYLITDKKEYESKIYQIKQRQKEVLSSSRSHIAVIDQSGKIVFVNQAWMSYGAQHGVKNMSSIDVGANYLLVLHRSIETGDIQSQRALDGIQNVLNGNTTEDILRYSTEINGEIMWYLAHVTPVVVNGGNGAIIMHQEITVRMNEEMKLRKLIGSQVCMDMA